MEHQRETAALAERNPVTAPKTETRRRPMVQIMQALVAAAAISAGPGFPHKAQGAEVTSTSRLAQAERGNRNEETTDFTPLLVKSGIGVRMYKDLRSQHIITDEKLSDCKFEISSAIVGRDGSNANAVAIIIRCFSAQNMETIHKHWGVGVAKPNGTIEFDDQFGNEGSSPLTGPQKAAFTYMYGHRNSASNGRSISAKS